MKVAITKSNYKIPKLENRVINLPIFKLKLATKLNPFFIALFLIAESISVSKQN